MSSHLQRIRLHPWYVFYFLFCTSSSSLSNTSTNRYSVAIVAWTAFCHPGMFGALNVSEMNDAPSEFQLMILSVGLRG